MTEKVAQFFAQSRNLATFVSELFDKAERRRLVQSRNRQIVTNNFLP